MFLLKKPTEIYFQEIHVIQAHPAIEGALEERLEVRGEKKVAVEFSWHLINRRSLGESDGGSTQRLLGPYKPESPGLPRQPLRA